TIVPVIKNAEIAVPIPVIRTKGNRLLVGSFGVGYAAGALVGVSDPYERIRIARIQRQCPLKLVQRQFRFPIRIVNAPESHIHYGKTVIQFSRPPAIRQSLIGPFGILIQRMLHPVRLTQPGVSESETGIGADRSIQRLDRKTEVLWLVTSLHVTQGFEV